MHHRILALAALGFSSVGYAQSPAPDAFQAAYLSHLDVGDSVINMTNAGTVSGNDPAGDICVNVHGFDSAEELIGCCSCLVTPNGLNSLSAQRDLVLSTLSPGGIPTSMVIKLVATLANPSVVVRCNAGDNGVRFPATGDGS
ncbi:MAG: hypothetical protein ABSH09_21350 [Bryobacteraceae bacterium]|jgi:hypothetical protein